MYQNGYALIEVKTGAELQTWLGANYGECPAAPNPLILPNGDHVHCAEIDHDYGGYKLIAKYNDQEWVPLQVSPRQIRLALLEEGLLDAVNKAVAASDAETKIAWDYSGEIKFDDPGVIAIAKALGKNDAQRADLFRLAASK